MANQEFAMDKKASKRELSKGLKRKVESIIAEDPGEFYNK